jgi:hypothetical protein
MPTAFVVREQVPSFRNGFLVETKQATPEAESLVETHQDAEREQNDAATIPS